MISSDEAAALLKRKGVELAGLASNPERLERAVTTIYRGIPIPLRWFVGRKRLKRLVVAIANKLDGSTPAPDA